MSTAIIEGLRPAVDRMLSLATGLAKDIPADRFARFASGADGAIVSNHPAFVCGHLSLYPARVAGMLGLQLEVEAPAAWQELFRPGAECVDDADGSIYGPRDELIGTFVSLHERLLTAAEGVDDQVFFAATAEERYRARFPTTLTAVSFLLLAHPMFHLGQLSAWRRAEGLGSIG
ncbi:MAG: DinB family protein [Planctomycetota bacterium]